MEEVVVDTNILVRASNGALDDYEECLLFLDTLAAAKTFLCVDEGFDSDAARNRSLIGYEYIKHLQFGMVGLAVITALIQDGRVKIRPRTVTPSELKRLNQLIPNKWDRTFVRVAVNTLDRTLVSHDFRDFTNEKRKIITHYFDVRICRAGDATPDL